MFTCWDGDIRSTTGIELSIQKVTLKIGVFHEEIRGGLRLNALLRASSYRMASPR
jgi:malate synthase